MTEKLLTIILLALSANFIIIECGNEIKLNDIMDCPPWTILNETSNNCECGSDLKGIVQCNSKTLEVSVKACYCMTYSEKLNGTFVSYCLYACSYYNFQEYHHIYAKNTSELNEKVCGSFDRTGLMCGECIAEHAPSVYSYDLACVECKDYKYNWLKYIAVAYLPLTAFYILMIVLRVSVNSGPMVVYVAVSQMVAAPGILRFIFNAYPESALKNFFVLAISLYSVWNLDFFRGFYHPFCLHPDISIFQTISLDYAVAVYPLMLISITYCLVRLHDRYIVFSKLSLPVYRCCSTFRRKWNIRESLVNAFATFFILSYVKIMNVSFDILTLSNAYYDESGNEEAGVKFLFINGSMTPFSKEHTPYAVLAIFMFLIFNFLPLVLLCVYPSRCFQKCLNCTKCQYQTLHVFMDTFQGCYKETPRDCRYFAGFYLLLRSLNQLLYAATKNPLYASLAMYMMMFALLLVAVCKPYKHHIRNTIDIVIFLIAIAMYAASSSIIDAPFTSPTYVFEYSKDLQAIILPILFILPLYGLFLLIYQVVSLLKIGIPDCGCHALMRKIYKTLFSEGSQNDQSRPNEHSPLLNNIS